MIILLLVSIAAGVVFTCIALKDAYRKSPYTQYYVHAIGAGPPEKARAAAPPKNGRPAGIPPEKQRKATYKRDALLNEYYQLCYYRRQQQKIYGALVEQYDAAPDKQKTALYKQVSMQKHKLHGIDNKIRKIRFELNELKMIA